MREGSPSRTAQHVAAYRLGCPRLPSAFGDPDADDRLASDVAAGIEPRQDPKMAGYLRYRTAFFDRVVVNGLDRGVTQIAMIGAGYDGRALRYAKPGVRWFEVDHPATQQDKRDRLARLAITTPATTFVSMDLVHDDVAAALTAEGFAPDAPSLLLCEGLVVYLAPSVLTGLLARLRSIATAGTRLALSTGIPGADPDRRERFAAAVARAGEPVALGDADVPALLTGTRWRLAELSERSQRAGMLVGVPVWEPGAPSTISRIGAYLEQTFHRDGMDSLAEHLTSTYGITVAGTRLLDVGVVRVDRSDGAPWIARVFPAARPPEATHGDAEILIRLAEVGYPAERPACAAPVSEHNGQEVLVTAFLDGKAPPATQATYRQLGEQLGRLHVLPDMPRRPGGAWHHLALSGGPESEISALRVLLAGRVHVPPEGRPQLIEIEDEVARLDDFHDLPLTFTHPDFVQANAIQNGDELVMIDWAGAGVAPRLWSLAFLLWSAGQAGPRHVEAAAKGYRQHIALDAAELERLASAVGGRPLIFDAWSYATGRRPLSEVAAHRADVRSKAHEIAARARPILEEATPAS